MMGTQYTVLFDQLRKAQEEDPELIEAIQECAILRDENESIAELSRFVTELQEGNLGRIYYYSGS